MLRPRRESQQPAPPVARSPQTNVMAEAQRVGKAPATGQPGSWCFTKAGVVGAEIATTANCADPGSAAEGPSAPRQGLGLVLTRNGLGEAQLLLSVTS